MHNGTNMHIGEKHVKAKHTVGETRNGTNVHIGETCKNKPYRGTIYES
jgi:hypothetical protein